MSRAKREAWAHLEADFAVGVGDEVAGGGAAALLEVRDGHVRLAPVARAVDLVRLPVAAVAQLLLHQPHLQKFPHNSITTTFPESIQSQDQHNKYNRHDVLTECITSTEEFSSRQRLQSAHSQRTLMCLQGRWCAHLGVDGDDDGGVPGEVAAAGLWVLVQEPVHVAQQLHHALVRSACI